jgi:hypothetical protein
MNGFAICLVGLALAQGEPGEPRKDDGAATAAPNSPPTSTATPTPTPTPNLDPAAAPAPRPTRRAPAVAPAPAPIPRGTAAAEGVRPTPASVAGEPPTAKAEPEREQALRAARAFLAALAASDPDVLAQVASERFSFDGEAVSGRDAVRRRWRELLAGRPGPAPKVNAVEVLSAQDALARWGKPPARVAALARPGVWVALGDVGGRPVVLFLGREGGRVAVLGIHD